MNSGVYRICCSQSGREYIGSSRDLGQRFIDHFKALRRGDHHCKHLQAAFNKYGQHCFTFEIIAFVAEEALLEEEQHAIQRARWARFRLERAALRTDL